jgi:hypothetical protein
MKKSMQSVLLTLGVLMALLNGCTPASTPVPPMAIPSTPIPATSTSSPIPPTFTPDPTATQTPIPATIPPTSTPRACPTAKPASAAGDILAPANVIARDQIKLYPQSGVNLGYAAPKSITDTMLAVFLDGIENDQAVSVNDMDWTVIDEKCNQLKSIGFGVHVSSLAEPVVFIGELTSGSVTFQAEAKPVLILIFVVSKPTTEVTLRSPQGNDYKVPVSADWLPTDEQAMTGLNVSSDGFIKIPLAGGENWTQNGASVTSQP